MGESRKSRQVGGGGGRAPDNRDFSHQPTAQSDPYELMRGFRKFYQRGSNFDNVFSLFVFG